MLPRGPSGTSRLHHSGHFKAAFEVSGGSYGRQRLSAALKKQRVDISGYW